MSLRLTRAPLSMAAAMRELEGSGVGGIALFAGRVRPDPGPTGRVAALVYDVHRGPALRRLRELDGEARRRFDARRIVLWHRFGRLPVGTVSVIVGAGCPHRAEAFAAARYLIDELKRSVPIWKTERARPGRPRRPRPSRRGGPSTG